MDGWNHEWKVSSNKFNNPDDKTEITARISDYYYAESTKTKNPAYPRHHALILAALGSSSKFVSRVFPATIVSGYERTRPATPRLTSSSSSSSSTVTKLATTYQKHHLVALAGMTGLLVTRLFMLTPRINSLKTKKKHAEITQQYIHSALAAEYLVGNRYYRLGAAASFVSTTPLEKEKHPVGFLERNFKSRLTAADIAPDAIRATQEELRQLYNANIDRLFFMTQQYKHGFVSRDTIRKDPEFVKMMAAFWRFASQLMKMRDEFEAQTANPLTQLWFSSRQNARRITLVSMVAEIAVIIPGLYDYDVARIFDNPNGSYTKYIQTTKATWLRLAGDGSNASFLAFAAIEPTMVTEDYAPKIGGAPEEYHGLSLKSCANYIPSRDPIFGALKKRHSCHMIRTADAVNMSFGQVHPLQPESPARGVCRDRHRFEPRYAPFYEMVEDVREKNAVIENDDDCKYAEDKCENTGIIVSAFDGIREFRERVWPTVGRAIMSEYTRGCQSDDIDDINDYDDYDDYDEYDDYDDDN